MCGRITQKAGELPGLVTIMGGPDDSRTRKPRYNGAPSQDFLVIRQDPDTGEYRRDVLVWRYLSPWMRDNGIKPQINARDDKVATSGMWKDSYARRRCLVPIDNFFEWRQTKPPKQAYAIAMADGSPFAVAGLWTSYRVHDGVVRTFAIITCPANELVATIHPRMPVIIARENYDRWLAHIEPDPRDLLVPYPSELMTMWPISTRVNKPDNDDPSILDRL